MYGMFSQVLNLCGCFKVCFPFRILNKYPCDLQEKKVQVFELIPMDLLDKPKKMIMTSLLILYNPNLVPLVFFASTPFANPEQ